MEEIFYRAIEAIAHISEAFGVVIIAVAAVQSFVGVFLKKAEVRLSFAQSMATALEFKLAGEILRTVVVRRWEEIALVGAIILLRAALTVLIHWEIKNELNARQNGEVFVENTKKKTPS